MANVEDDTGVGGKREDFERALVHLLLKDLVGKKRNSTGRRTQTDILDTTAMVGKVKQKPRIRKSGVHLRYHKPEQYDNLSRPQNKELMGWRAANGGGKADGVFQEEKEYLLLP